MSNTYLQRTHSIYREYHSSHRKHILSIENTFYNIQKTFYIQRKHSIYREHVLLETHSINREQILSTENTFHSIENRFYLQRTHSTAIQDNAAQVAAVHNITKTYDFFSMNFHLQRTHSTSLQELRCSRGSCSDCCANASSSTLKNKKNCYIHFPYVILTTKKAATAVQAPLVAPMTECVLYRMCSLKAATAVQAPLVAPISN